MRTIPSKLSLAANMHSAMRWLCRSTLVALALVAAGSPVLAQSTPVSSVDYSLVGSQKYVLRVGGKPFFMNAIQLRCDKLRYYSTYLWTMGQCSGLAGQAASDGFNTITVPITWYEVEPAENNFDWTILDDYLAMANTNNLKLELIWEGVNDDGGTGWEGDSGNPVHLRTPDYVLYAPSYGSTATTSNYTIVSGYPFRLDLNDTNLRARETYVLGKVAAQIATWDAANGNKHPVVGFQIENEPQFFSEDSLMVGYMSAVANGIKTSSYSVWTRSNTTDSGSTVSSRVAANAALRSGGGTNLDFIGIDDYSNNVTNIEAAQPFATNNFAEIMENGGQNSASVRLAALAGNEALDTYDMCGPDAGEGLYNEVGSGSTATWTPAASNIGGVRAVNHLLDTDPVDLALNAQGKGLFVHNWASNSTSPSTGGTLGITFTPSNSSVKGISIMRSGTEIVLMTTGSGTFTLPASLNVSSASQGYFDSNNDWVNQGSVPFTNTSITPTAYTTVLLTYNSPVSVSNSSFESPVTSTYVYNPSEASWTFSGSSPSGSGVTTNGSNFTSGNAPAPIGTQVAFLEETGSMTEVLSGLTPGTTYTVSFRASQRQAVGSGTQAGETFDLTINGTMVASFAPPQSTPTYATYSATFNAISSSETLGFIGTNHNGGDNTVFIDNVQVYQ